MSASVEKRIGERRADWHTPDDCHRLLDAQTSMDEVKASISGINFRLDKGQLRMDKIEDAIFANHLEAVTERKRMAELLQKNTDVTTEIKDILEAGKGFFRAVGKIGSFARAAILWVLPVVTAVLSLWYVITGHEPK